MCRNARKHPHCLTRVFIQHPTWGMRHIYGRREKEREREKVNKHICSLLCMRRRSPVHAKYKPCAHLPEHRQDKRVSLSLTHGRAQIENIGQVEWAPCSLYRSLSLSPHVSLSGVSQSVREMDSGSRSAPHFPSRRSNVSYGMT